MVVMVFVSNAYLFNLSQPQFKDSVYFFLKVVIIIIVLVRTCHHLHSRLNKPQKVLFHFQLISILHPKNVTNNFLNRPPSA